MAHLARIEPARSVFLPVAQAPLEDTLAEPRFSELEWSIIRLAKAHRLWTIRPATRLTRFLRRLAGRNPNPRLANPRLEALRRIAVLSWHFGFTVPGEDVAEFLEAGFSLEQYELLVTSVRGAASKIIPFPKAGIA